MRDRERHQEILGLKSPWSVSHGTLNFEERHPGLTWKSDRRLRVCEVVMQQLLAMETDEYEDCFSLAMAESLFSTKAAK